MPNFRKLIYVFEDAGRLLSRPENDYSYSSWEDNSDATSEIGAILTALRNGELPSTGILFAPTGPMQEVAVISGWGGEFLDLADRFDQAMAEEDIFDDAAECNCLSHLETTQELGIDSNFAEASIQQCKACGRLWLRYFYENEAFTGSGRWFVGQLQKEPTPTAQTARHLLEAMDSYYCGGSYFGGKVNKSSGPLAV